MFSTDGNLIKETALENIHCYENHVNLKTSTHWQESDVIISTSLDSRPCTRVRKADAHKATKSHVLCQTSAVLSCRSRDLMTQRSPSVGTTPTSTTQAPCIALNDADVTRTGCAIPGFRAVGELKAPPPPDVTASKLRYLDSAYDLNDMERSVIELQASEKNQSTVGFVARLLYSSWAGCQRRPICQIKHNTTAFFKVFRESHWETGGYMYNLLQTCKTISWNNFVV